MAVRGAGQDDRPAPDGPGKELQRLRHSIDNLDAALLYLLAECYKQTQQRNSQDLWIGVSCDLLIVS